MGATKRCCLSWLTNSALVYEHAGGGEGGCSVSANEYSCAHRAQINFGDLTSYLTLAGQYTEPDFVNFSGAQEPIPWNRFLSSLKVHKFRYRQAWSVWDPPPHTFCIISLLIYLWWSIVYSVYRTKRLLWYYSAILLWEKRYEKTAYCSFCKHW
jgi:hypothetical protein